MKLKQILFVIILLVIITAGIVVFSKYYLGSESSDSVNPETKKKLNIQFRKSKLNPELESIKGEFYRLQTLYPTDDKSAGEKLDSLSVNINKIVEFQKELSKFEDFKSTSQYSDFIELRDSAFDEYTSFYQDLLHKRVNELLFWCMTDSALKLVDEHESQIPEELKKQTRIVEITNNIKKSILREANSLSKIDSDIIKFIKNSKELIVIDNDSNTEFSSKIETWLSKFKQIKQDKSPEELKFLNNWLKNIFREIDRIYFKSADFSENIEQFNYALEFFPLSYQVLNFVEEDQAEDGNYKEINKLFFSVLRLLRQDLLNFGVTNKYLVDSVKSSEIFKILILSKYLAFYCQYIPDFYETELLVKYVNSLFECINEIFNFEGKSNNSNIYNKLDLNIAQSSYVTLISKLEEIQEYSWANNAKMQISSKYNGLIENPDKTLSEFEEQQSLEFEKITRLYANAVIYEAGDFHELLRKLFSKSLKHEFEKIESYESNELRNVKYSELFVTIDSLISILTFFNSPELQYVNENISEYYKDDLQRSVTDSLRLNQMTIKTLIEEVDKGVSVSFAGFATDFYSRIILQLKGDKQVTQEFVNEYQSYFLAHYRTYLTFAEILKNSSINTVYDAMMFSSNYVKISRFTVIDDMLENQSINRTKLISLLQSKNNSCSDMIEHIITIKSLDTLSSKYNVSLTDWDSWNDLGKIKSQLLSLKMKSSQNEFVQSGLIMIDELLKNSFYEILTQHFEAFKGEQWLVRAKWFTRNFNLDPDKKNNIDEKMKILIK